MVNLSNYERQGSMNRQYIEDHIPHAHTPESFGRAILQQALQTARGIVPDQGAESVSLDATVTISPVRIQSDGSSLIGCIKACVTIGGATICGAVHV